MLKFSKDRDKYFDCLRETNKRFRISILDYMITSNHIHLLIWARRGEQISKAMQFLQGTFAQYYNKQHKRQGAFWSDRYHPTMIQSGQHFGKALFYIDLNMRRAGAVKTIEEWKHTGLHEFTGAKRRYCVIDKDRLIKCLGMRTFEDFQLWYTKTLQKIIKEQYLAKESFWSNSIAVGNEDWVNEIYIKQGLKRKKILSTTFDNIEIDDTIYKLKESQAIYFIKD
jgi:putative transposase